MTDAPPIPPARVSVALPTRGRPEHLRRAVESVFAQSIEEWELVISDDDPSPGETWRYLLDLAARASTSWAISADAFGRDSFLAAADIAARRSSLARSSSTIGTSRSLS